MRQHSRYAAIVGALAALVLVVGPHAMHSSDAINVSALGPQIGERVPDFTLPDQSGRARSLESILGPNGALVLFHRSADW